MSPSSILKFGGSSVGSPESIRRVIEIIRNKCSSSQDNIRGVVVSAFQGVTDSLIQLASLSAARNPQSKTILAQLERRHIDALQELTPPVNRSSAIASVKVLLNELEDLLQGVQILGECSPRTRDHIMSFGERLSAFIIAQALVAAGHAAHSLDARSVVFTDEQHGNALYDASKTYAAIANYFSTCSSLPVITGFIGSTSQGATTTLGRGGSDLTASIFGAALDVDCVEIWTDVDGILTADPRKVPNAFPMSEVTFEEAMELCHFGAKVIYPPTMRPAMEAHIPLVVKNTFNPAAPGTRVAHHAVNHPSPVTGISSITSVALLRLQGPGMLGVTGTAARFFAALAQARINVILITQASSEHTICCAIEPSQCGEARTAVESAFQLEITAGLIEPLLIEESLSVLSVVGERMRHHPGMSGRIFAALGSNGVNVVAIAQGSSERNISAVVAQADEVKALNAIHDEFFTGSSRVVNLWLIGTGGIGATLLSLLHQQYSYLVATTGLDIRLRGVANRRKMLLQSHSGGTLKFEWGAQQEQHSATYSAPDFIEDCLRANAPHSIFVDCTASDEVPLYYPGLLERSISVVTPNKRGFSSSLEFYDQLRASSDSRRTPLLHETCVGAALPVLGTLKDLVRSGDTIVCIDAVLSGTLSFIFNSMGLGSSFSDAVIQARKNGYTEPDPRDDLSGMDVARKVLILARDAGLRIEFPDITIEPLLPAAALAGSVDQFLTTVPSLDTHFQEMVEQAKLAGKRMFFAAHIDCSKGTATIGLQSVSLAHPFCSLTGTDNIVTFTTHRYRKNPLVIKGPGAGAEVTAAGVFADIIRAAR